MATRLWSNIKGLRGRECSTGREIVFTPHFLPPERQCKRMAKDAKKLAAKPRIAPVRGLLWCERRQTEASESTATGVYVRIIWHAFTRLGEIEVVAIGDGRWEVVYVDLDGFWWIVTRSSTVELAKNRAWAFVRRGCQVSETLS